MEKKEGLSIKSLMVIHWLILILLVSAHFTIQSFAHARITQQLKEIEQRLERLEKR